jgi:hypothetical protein
MAKITKFVPVVLDQIRNEFSVATSRKSCRKGRCTTAVDVTAVGGAL